MHRIIVWGILRGRTQARGGGWPNVVPISNSEDIVSTQVTMTSFCIQWEGGGGVKKDEKLRSSLK